MSPVAEAAKGTVADVVGPPLRWRVRVEDARHRVEKALTAEGDVEESVAAVARNNITILLIMIASCEHCGKGTDAIGVALTTDGVTTFWLQSDLGTELTNSQKKKGGKPKPRT